MNTLVNDILSMPRSEKHGENCLYHFAYNNSCQPRNLTYHINDGDIQPDQVAQLFRPRESLLTWAQVNPDTCHFFADFIKKPKLEGEEQTYMVSLGRGIRHLSSSEITFERLDDMMKSLTCFICYENLVYTHQKLMVQCKTCSKVWCSECNEKLEAAWCEDMILQKPNTVFKCPHCQSQDSTFNQNFFDDFIQSMLTQ